MVLDRYQQLWSKNKTRVAAERIATTLRLGVILLYFKEQDLVIVLYYVFACSKGRKFQYDLATCAMQKLI